MKQKLNLFILFLILFIGQVNYVKADTTIASGTISGTSIKWTLTSPNGARENMKLSFTGSGKIPDYTHTSSPWENYNPKTTEVSIASTITEIGDYTFYKAGLSSVNIPSSCTKIGSRAFYKCTNLKEIYIPAGVVSIGLYAFEECKSLSLIHYDGRCTANTGIAFSGVAANGKLIEKEGTGTSYAKVPSGWEYYTHGDKCRGGAWVAECGTKLFVYGQYPSSVVNSTAPASVSSADAEEPEYHPWKVNCEKYTSLEINRNAFVAVGEFMGYYNSPANANGYTNIEAITVESGNPDYVVGEDGALYSKKKNIIYLYPAKNTATHIDIPETVTRIDPFAFFGAKNLKSVNFLGTITNLESGAFFGASSLNYMFFATETAPKYYSKSALYNLASTGKVVVPVETDAWKKFTNTIGTNWTLSVGAGSYISSDGTLYVIGKGAYNTTSSSASWYSQRSSIKKIVVEEGVTDIGSSAFANCSNVTEVTLNNTGTIGVWAFYGCTALTRVNIGSGVTEFSASYSGTTYYTPFSGCSKLSEVNVSSLASFLKIAGLKYLDSSYGTAKEKTLMINGVTHSSSSELVIPEGVTEIPSVAFRNFKNVTKIKLPSTMTKIANSNFENHTYLTEVTLPSSVTSVGESAFKGCTALTTVTLNNTGTIGVWAFYGCTALTRVNIGSGVTEFSASYSGTTYYTPFSGCSKLSEVNVSSLASFLKIAGLKYLDSSYGTAKEKTLMINGVTHSSSSELVIPEGVTEIPSVAFRYFKNVTKLRLPSTMTEIANYNFENHTYLTKINLPSTVTSVGSSAFSGCSNLERIICQATTPPATTGSIASNPSEITLKVPSGKAATYKAANIWKEFNIEEGRIYNYSVTMRANESRQFTNNLLNEQKVVLNTSTNSSIASSAVSSKNVTINAGTIPAYYGTTTYPYKSAVIRLYLEEGDVLTYNVSVYPREVALTDGNAYKLAKEFTADKISYTRTYAEKYAGNLQCFYVPFDVEVTDDLLEDFTFYKLYMVSQKDENGNGEIEEDEPLVMLLNRIPAGQVMTANMPYYIRPKAESTLTVTAYNTTLYAATNGKVSCSTTEKEYTLTGNNASKNIKGYYTMSAKGNFSYYTKDTTLGSYRWYMSVRDRMGSGAEYENYARPIEILIVGEDDTTGIVALDDKASASKNDKIYTLDGRQVTDFETLPSGIYIVNGKKVFKK